MNIDTLTIREAKQLVSMFENNQNINTLNSMIGEKVIIRTYSAGVWFGILSQKLRDEVILTSARRMYEWWAKESISLSAVSIYGVKHNDSKIIEAVDEVWLQAIEILPCSAAAIKSLESSPHVKAS